MTGISFDIEATMRNLNSDMDLIRSVAEIVIQDLPKVVAEMKAAATAHDERKLHQAAHAIKGMAGNFTAQPLMELARQLESGHFDTSPHEELAAVLALEKMAIRTLAALQREFGLSDDCKN